MRHACIHHHFAGVKILALQLKRIGDLVLTTPALEALRRAMPDAGITLAVHESSSGLLSAIPQISAGIIFGPGRGWTPWQQVLTGRFDVVLDFTGTDRSALAAWLSRAKRRVTFEWAQKRQLRAKAYHEFVDSPVRDAHTVDHYMHLLRPLGIEGGDMLSPKLSIPDAARREAERLLQSAGVTGPFAVMHPGSARLEKYWQPERWAQVIHDLREKHGLICVVTGGSDPQERQHLDAIFAAVDSTKGSDPTKVVDFAGKGNLLTFAAILEKARLVLSCDTAAVHLAAAFQTPQIVLFGPTNPFHWRPRHRLAVVFSSAQPDGPITEFNPRMKGAPMDELSAGVVTRAIDSVLQNPASVDA